MTMVGGEDAEAVVFFKARRFARGRVTVGRCNAPPSEGAADRWKPKIAGDFVRNDDDPPVGFKTADEARAAAERYRADCRRYVAARA